MIDPDANAAVEEWRRLGGTRPPARPAEAPRPAGLAALLAAILALFRR